MKKGFLVLFFVLLMTGIGVGYKLLTRSPAAPAETQKETVEIKTFHDYKSGVELSLPIVYKSLALDNQPKTLDNSKTSILMQLEQSNPQSFVIVQHDTGLSGPAALSHQSTLEYLENTIRQFYPVRYGSSYKSESLERTKVRDHDAVEHVYTYTDKDGKPNKVKLLTIVWSNDETYNVILQSSEANFEAIKDDLDSVKTTFKATE